MTWTESHIWEAVIKVNSSNFLYKYVLKQGEEVEWETGYNRIADMKLLPDNKAVHGSKSVELFDIWQSF